MLYRTLGKTNWKVAVIGFGAWGIGGQWGAVAQGLAVETIKAAYDAGVNFFDTADAYGEPQGLSEELVGTALAGVRDKVFIATKAGNWARRYGHPLPYTHPNHVEGCCDASLYRLKTDCIDLYQNHIGAAKEAEVFLQAFDNLLRKGKIRAFGISTDSVEAVAAFNRDGRLSAVQLDYSFLNRSAERELLPYCQSHGIGAIIRGPLAKGLATGKFTQQSVFTDQVRQGWNEGAEREKFLKSLAIVDQLRFLEQPGRTLAQAALQFVAAHSAVSVAIPGAKSPDQARANAAAGNGMLSAEEMAKVKAATS